MVAFRPFMRSALIALWPGCQRRELGNNLIGRTERFRDLKIIEIDDPGSNDAIFGKFESGKAPFQIDIDHAPGTLDIAECHHITNLYGCTHSGLP